MPTSAMNTQVYSVEVLRSLRDALVRLKNDEALDIRERSRDAIISLDHFQTVPL